ncbi:hypothetical protein N2603_36620 [Bradyrhizobium huanghuaihaiense]|uniref:hypothetical protein n=1 Tax=Bradyrhizobium huanghuaihaiense TaxID=990078 RepID=UPI0021AA0AA9|nr:hypothetical protein [Bradyrhizobium sp. CB3035]UWU75493.1 hypothetical protein N2603_36620 [Bradyrhizobium sp. CB3035]
MAAKHRVDFFIKKLKWLDEIGVALGKDHLAAHVAMVIAKHMSSDTGDTFVGRNTIADLIAANVRTVEIAIQKIETLGFLKVQRARGRGHCNTYTLAFPEKAVSAPPFEEEKAVHAPPFEAEEKAVDGELKGGEEPPKRRSPDRPNLKDSNLEEITFGKFGERDGAAAAPPFRLRSPQAVGRPTFKPIPNSRPRAFQDRGEFEQRLAELISEAGRDGWNVLMDLDEVRVAALCRRLRNGVLTQIEISELCGPRRKAGAHMHNPAGGAS